MSSKNLLFSYSTCSTCRKAISWLDKNEFEYELIDIVKEPPSLKILSNALNQLGNRKLLLNTSGVSYRRLGAETVKAMTDQELLENLCRDGKLIKRPFLIMDGGLILVGFKVGAWEEALIG